MIRDDGLHDLEQHPREKEARVADKSSTELGQRKWSRGISAHETFMGSIADLPVEERRRINDDKNRR
jgi:hypothetical protein